MFRGQRLIPPKQMIHRVRLWQRVSWWHTATEQQVMQYNEYTRTGYVITPGWTTTVEK